MWFVLSSFIVGYVASWVMYHAIRNIFSNPILMRTNLNNRQVATAGGLVFLIALIPIWLVVALLRHGEPRPFSSDYVTSVLLGSAVIGLFGLLGLIDDLLATGSERGFLGHLGSLARGHLSTGSIKLLGGGVGALALVALTTNSSWGRIVLGGAAVALGANLANLFDRAPARVTKVATVLFLLAGVSSLMLERASLAEPKAAWGAGAIVLGMAWGLFRPELREAVMLGDTGANPVGASLGLIGALVASTPALVVLCLVLVALNLLSERVSFSSVIAKNRLLRWVDSLGRAG